MAPAEPPTTITIRLKVPLGSLSSGTDEYTLGRDVSVDLSVGQLRHLIQGSLPTNPPPERQRLLYAGRALLDNDQSLSEALNVKRDPSQKEYVVHLLVRGDGRNTPPIPQQRATPVQSTAGAPAAQASGVAQQPMAHAQTPDLAFQHYQQQHAAFIAQQQRLHAQIMQNMTRPWPGAVPLGTPTVNIGAQLPTANVDFINPVNRDPNTASFGMPPAGVQAGDAHTAGTAALPGSQLHLRQSQTESAINSNPATVSAQPSSEPLASSTASGTSQDSVFRQAASSGETVNSNEPLAAPEQQFAQPRPSGNISFPGQGRQHISIRQGYASFPAGQYAHPALAFGLPSSGFGFPQVPGVGIPPQNQLPSNGPSALDRARQNVTEMRQMLAELRGSNLPPDELQSRIQRLEDGIHSLNDYIDPFNTSNLNQRAVRPANVPQPTISPHGPASNSRLHPPAAVPNLLPAPGYALNQPRQPQSSSNVTCHLLSSPSGPRAILFSPQYGRFTGALPTQPQLSVHPPRHPTSSQAPHGSASDGTENAAGAQNQAAADPVRAADGAGQLQLQALQQEPFDPIGPLLGYFWLLLRVGVFLYFLLGTNLGWRRPLILFAVGMVFWAARRGLFGDGGVFRRWWDGILQLPPQPEQAPRGEQQRGEQGQRLDGHAQHGRGEDVPPAANGAERQPRDAAPVPAENARPGRMPTPEQLAQRLLDGEARAQRDAQNARLHWLRERLRPIERAAALFIASLWPGVGEAQVRARELDARRRAEEEDAVRRRMEEESRRREEEDRATEKVEHGSTGEGSGQRNGAAEAKEQATSATEPQEKDANAAR